MTLIYYVSQWWSLYQIRFLDVMTLEAIEALGANIPFSIEPIILNL